MDDALTANQNTAGITPDEAAESEYRFGEKIISELPAALDAAGYVYGTIESKETARTNGAAGLSVCISLPIGDDAPAACFDLSPQYSNYMIWRDEKRAIAANASSTKAKAADPDNPDPRAEAEIYAAVDAEYFGELVSTLARAYNDAYTSYLKNMKSYEELRKGAESPAYILENAMPDLVDLSLIADPPDGSAGDPEYGAWLLAPADIASELRESANIACSFVISDSKNAMFARLKGCDGYLEDPSFLPDLIFKSVARLNSKILNMLWHKPIANYAFEDMTPFELPQAVVDKLISAAEDKLASIGGAEKAVVAGLSGTTLSASSILLSRTAMLKLAGIVRAKRRIMAIPVSCAEIMLVNADEESDAVRDLAMDIAGMAKEGIKDPTRIIFDTPYAYDIITGKLKELT